MQLYVRENGLCFVEDRLNGAMAVAILIIEANRPTSTSSLVAASRRSAGVDKRSLALLLEFINGCKKTAEDEEKTVAD